MGVADTRLALELARSGENAYFLPPVSEAEIREAEHYLGVKFPPSYREFVAAVGCASFAGREFYGITPHGIADTSVPSVTFATADERRHGLPHSLILIEAPGTEEEYVLDTGNLGYDGEAPVRMWMPGRHPNHLELVADDFGTYLLSAARSN